ncbi:hypothetical protein [Microcoleus sp. B4-C1]|uniref:hypothetical protein n=1 Tax=Microcoleus sp. B4-C1 TaxID=2818660 RepID=UPI002FD13E5A
MEPNTVRPLVISLHTVRSGILKELCRTDDKETRAALFDAQYAVGFALLYLERVIFLSYDESSEGETVERKGFKLNG